MTNERDNHANYRDGKGGVGSQTHHPGAADGRLDAGEDSILRLRVVGGGCSGYQHKLDLDPAINEKLDEVFDFHGVPVVVDKRSLIYLDNAQVDFHDDLNRRGFSISNPAAKSTCGCGSSFSM